MTHIITFWRNHFHRGKLQCSLCVPQAKVAMQFLCFNIIFAGKWQETATFLPLSCTAVFFKYKVAPQFSLQCCGEQELPALSSTVRGAHSKAKRSVGVWRTRLQKLLNKHLVKDLAKKLRKGTQSGRRPRLAARNFLRGWDHSGQFINKGFNVFASRNSVPLLGRDEVRYAVASKRKLDGLVPDGIPVSRSCCYNKGTKVTRYDVELPACPNDLSCCVAIGDEGPKDLPSFWYLPSQGYRVVPFMDVLHRCPRDMAEAAKASDNWAMVTDTTAVLNYDHGPFKSQVNFQKSVEAIQSYASTVGPDDELLNMFFEEICDAEGDHPSDFGSPEHFARVLQNLPFDKAFASMTEKVKWTRWGSHHWSLVDFLPMKPKKALSLFIVGLLEDAVPSDLVEAVGLSSNIGKSFRRNAERAQSVALGPASSEVGAASSSGASSSSSAAPALDTTAPPSVAVAAAVPVPASVDASAAASGLSTMPPPGMQPSRIEALRLECPTGLEAILRVLVHEETWSKARVWSTTSHFVWKAHVAEYAGIRSGDDCKKYYMAYARGQYMSVLSNVWKTLGSMDSLRSIGFVLELATVFQKREAGNADSPMRATQAELASRTFRTIVQIVRSRALTHMHYKESLPGRFALLLSQGAELRSALEYCSKAWKAMCDCESRRHLYKECADIWKVIPFLQWEIIREILAMLSEFGFAWVSPWVQQLLLCMFRSWGTSLPNELGFKALRARVALASNQKVHPNTAWMSLASSKVMGQFKRQHTHPDDVADGPTDTLPRSIHAALADEPSVPIEFFEKITKPQTDWNSYSGMSKNVIPAAWSLLLRVSDNDSWDDLTLAWTATMTIEGDAIRSTEDGAAFIVLARNRFGVLGWPCSVTKLRRKTTITVDTTPKISAMWMAVLDYSKWEAFELQPLPPVAAIASGCAPSISIESVWSGSILERSARAGFKGFPLPYVSRVLATFHVKESIPTPRTSLEKIVALLKYVFPAIDDNDLHAYLLARRGALPSRPLIKGEADLIDAVMDPSDKKEMKSENARCDGLDAAVAAHVASLKEGSKYLEVLGHLPLPLPKALKKKPHLKLVARKKLDMRFHHEFGKAKALMPVAKGCTLELIPKRRQWIAFYAGAVPGSRTRTWGKY